MYPATKCTHQYEISNFMYGGVASHCQVGISIYVSLTLITPRIMGLATPHAYQPSTFTFHARCMHIQLRSRAYVRASTARRRPPRAALKASFFPEDKGLLRADMTSDMAGTKEVGTVDFDTDNFLKTRYYDVNVRDRILFPLENFHEAFQHLPRSVRVLDYGTGPAILSVISAAEHASEIVLSDYAETNREALSKWLRRDTTAFDWSPYFDHVVQKLEGKGEREAREREERLREVVKEVAYCNIHEDPPIRTTCPGPYDVVSESLCLGDACHTLEDFTNGIAKLAALLKPGGTLMSLVCDRKMNHVTGVYTVRSKQYTTLNITGEYVVSILEQQGFSDIVLKKCCSNNDTTRDFQDENFMGYAFITAKKK